MDNYEYFTVVGRGDCPWCVKAEELLRDIKAEFYIEFHERGAVELTEAKQANNWRTVPMVTHVTVSGDDKVSNFIGGYTDLENFIKLRKNEEE